MVLVHLTQTRQLWLQRQESHAGRSGPDKNVPAQGKRMGRRFIPPFLLFPTLVCMASGGLVWLQLTRPIDGARLEPGGPTWQHVAMTVTPLRPEADGLRNGDVVIAVGEKPMGLWSQELFQPTRLRSRWHVGDTLVYTVLRNDERLHVPVTLGRHPPLLLLMRHWSIILFALSAQLISLFVLVRRPVDGAVRALFVWAWSLPPALTWLVGLSVYDLVSKRGFWLMTMSTSAAWLLSWGAILHFALVFPQHHWLVRRWRCLIPLIYAAPFSFYLAYLAVTWRLAHSTFGWLQLWRGADWSVALVYLVAAIIAVIQQYRASHGNTRRKIRWLAFAALLSLSATLLLWFLPSFWLGRSLIRLEALGLLLLPYPVALAGALLRYHLFDIDVIIRRTLVYALLTVMLTALYLGTVIVLEELLRPLVGRGQNSLVTSLATLALAALFRPLRSRIQRMIDRRFNRPKYDAEQVLAAFAAQIRDETDRERLSEALTTIVIETFHPAQVSIWLKEKRRP